MDAGVLNLAILACHFRSILSERADSSFPSDDEVIRGFRRFARMKGGWLSLKKIVFENRERSLRSRGRRRAEGVDQFLFGHSFVKPGNSLIDGRGATGRE
jgi:hypothetical protein